MITSSFTLAGLLLLGTGVLFVARRLTSITITVCWAITWFFLSPGASGLLMRGVGGVTTHRANHAMTSFAASYLTVAEVFPLKIRALAIAMFFSLGNLLGAIGPSLFGFLNSTGGTAGIFYGYLVVSCVLLLAAFVGLGHLCLLHRIARARMPAACVLPHHVLRARAPPLPTQSYLLGSRPKTAASRKCRRNRPLTPSCRRRRRGTSLNLLVLPCLRMSRCQSEQSVSSISLSVSSHPPPCFGLSRCLVLVCSFSCNTNMTRF